MDHEILRSISRAQETSEECHVTTDIKVGDSLQPHFTTHLAIRMRFSTVVAFVSLAAAAYALPSSTSSAASAVSSQLRTDQDPVYHFYIQSEPVGAAEFSNLSVENVLTRK